MSSFSQSPPHRSHFPPDSRPICSPVPLLLSSFFSVFYLPFSSFTPYYTFFIYPLRVYRPSPSLSLLPVAYFFSYPSISLLLFRHPHLPFLHHPQPSTSFPCSPPCSRPGLFPLIRLLVTHTHTHTEEEITMLHCQHS